MRAIDALHLEYPFRGARQLRKILAREAHPHAGRLHISTLMEKMGITASYRKPNTSKRHPAHKVYPYLLRYLAIERANHVWVMDITCLPMQRGFIYLAAVMDWATRRVLAWRVSNTLTADFCIEAVEEAIGRYGKPEVVNADQGTQFISDAFTLGQRFEQHMLAKARNVVRNLSEKPIPSALVQISCRIAKRLEQCIRAPTGLRGALQSSQKGRPIATITVPLINPEKFNEQTLPNYATYNATHYCTLISNKAGDWR
jgi:hypothetical protein